MPIPNQPTTPHKPPHVVIIGGGFGGLRAAKALKRAAVQVTLIDRTNHHLFQPLLYQVATAGLSAEEIAVPIRSVLSKQDNVRVLLGEVQAVDLEANQLRLQDGAKLSYDYVIIAAGTHTNYYNNPGWQEHSVGLKNLEDAFELRRRILIAFETAERTPDAQERQRLLTFCVIGGGPTGVEMAGAISELSRSILQRDFRSLTGTMIRVVLVEVGQRVLAAFEPRLSARALSDLKSLGVEVHIGATVTEINARGVVLKDEVILASVVCWAAGVAPQPLAKNLSVPANARGGIDVQPDCSIGPFRNAFAIGDIATYIPDGQTRPLPGVAPVAMQQAACVAQNIINDLRGKPRYRFEYFDKGMMATIGTSRAVLQYGRFRMTGFLAWMAWIFVHVYYIIGFRNRTMVLFNWFWAYLTARRGARLIPQTSPQFPELLATQAEHGSTGGSTTEKSRPTYVTDEILLARPLINRSPSSATS